MGYDTALRCSSGRAPCCPCRAVSRPTVVWRQCTDPAIVNQARKEALALKTRMTDDLEASLDRREKLAIGRIAQAENDATADVRAMTADIALTATRQLLIENINDKKADVLINSSIDI